MAPEAEASNEEQAQDISAPADNAIQEEPAIDQNFTSFDDGATQPQEAPQTESAIIETTTPSEGSSVLDSNLDSETRSAIENKLAAVSRLSENLDTEGINLDSLIPEVKVDDITPIAAPVAAPGYTVATVDQKAPQPVANKKALKIALAILGVIAASGAGYFGYLTLQQNGMLPSGPSIITPTETSGDQATIGDQLSGATDTATEQSGSDMSQSGDSASTDTTTPTDQGDSTTIDQPGDVAIPDGTDATDTNTSTDDTAITNENSVSETYVATKSRDELLTIGNLLVARAQKLATLAGTKQDARAKTEAGAIYQDAQKLLQLLENDANIDTLGKIEHDMNAVVQRFISLAQQLNGTTR